MDSLWPDLQETFYLLLGPFIASLLLPVFIGTGLFLAILMSFSRFWRVKEVIEVKFEQKE